jgi:hypothetical protein
MAYSDFTFNDLKPFNVKIVSNNQLFTAVAPLPAEEWLVRMLERSVLRAQSIGTEKARSEFIIAPILLEAQVLVGAEKVSLFSGTDFNVDEARGLKGRCDYLFCRSANSFQIETPVITVVEAKTDNINAAFPQCIAEMLAARIFNEREGLTIPCVYGVVTTGSLWRFMKLTGTTIESEERDRSVSDLEELLGILVFILRSTSIL